jgi:hypothetical protein
MNASKLIEELRSRGVVVEASGDRLRVDAPKGVVTEELREALAEHKTEVMALITITEEEIAWRVAAMLPQIPDSGPFPFLVARKDFDCVPNSCHSCGDPLNDNPGYICGPCSRAKHRALEIAIGKRCDGVVN